MAEYVLQYVNGSVAVVLLDEPAQGDLKLKGAGISRGLEKIQSTLSYVTGEVAASLTELAKTTKALEVEMAFEIGSGLDLQIVDLSSKSMIKVKMTLGRG